MLRPAFFIRPAEIRQKALKYWQNQRFLRAYLKGETLFPLIISFAKPGARQLLEHFDDARETLRQLRAGSKEQRGYGYSLVYQQIEHRQLGRQNLPTRVVFEQAEDYLRFIGKRDDFRRFSQLQQAILAQLPALRPWLCEHPLKALEHQSAWPALMQICRYFLAHPGPDKYIRELDISGVDSKFIERYRGLLRELLDTLLPPAAIDFGETSLGGHGFERRYGLRYDEPLIRLRILDQNLCGDWGLSDLSIPRSQFRDLAIPCERVFIVENKITGLSFPALERAVVIFGLGYAVEALRNARWLSDKPIIYWGDIDTHGFAILSRLRVYFPQTRSVLMDRQTLLDFRPLWGEETNKQRYTGDLSSLTEAEQRLFCDLRDNLLGPNLRLEQERIDYSYALRRLVSDFSIQADSPYPAD